MLIIISVINLLLIPRLKTAEAIEASIIERSFRQNPIRQTRNIIGTTFRLSPVTTYLIIAIIAEFQKV